MATSTIAVPAFDFAAFYYPQLLEALIRFKRQNCPEHTDESEYDALIQMLRAFACVGHLNNALVDMVANEFSLETARLPETIRHILRLINYEMSPATPAQSDIVLQLSSILATTTTIIPIYAQVATRQNGENAPVYFEFTAQHDVVRTDRVQYVFTYTANTNVWTDITANVVADVPTGIWTPVETAGDILYVGHSGVMWDKMTVRSTGGGPSGVNLVLEYYDGDFQDAPPVAVTNIGGGQLRFDINSLLGPNDRSGAVVRVRYHETGAQEDVVSQWDGSKNVVTTGLLGQSTPSTLITDYGVGCDWRELSVSVQTAGDTSTVEWDLPQTESSNWKRTEVNGAAGYFVRYRVISVSGAPAAGPSMALMRIDVGRQYVLALATQGRTVTGETLGGSTGAAAQRFVASREGFILGSQRVYVDAEEWTATDLLLNSGPSDKHYKVQLEVGDRAAVLFGNGTNGAIPALGQSNIQINYRYDAINNGNVGSNTIVVDKTGLNYVERLWNPRVAVGWSEAMSASDEGLARAKEEGPAALRNRDVALGPDDVAEMATKFTDASGARPYARAYAVEEGFGPKTIEVIVVPRGGGTASALQLETLAKYFNGDPTAMPRQRKRIVANQQVYASNYSSVSININATVYAPPEVTALMITTHLNEVLRAEALKPGGIEYAWEFGDEVGDSRIKHEIHSVDGRITKVVLNGFSPYLLGARELPAPGTIVITIQN